MTPQDAKDDWISHSAKYGHWEYEHPELELEILEFVLPVIQELNRKREDEWGGGRIEQAEIHSSFERSYKTLKMLRIEAGLSSKAVSLKFKRSPSWLTKVEKGEINLSDDTYDQMRDYYLIVLNRTAKVNAENDLNKLQFLVKENKMLRELLMMYIPTNQNDLEILLEQRKKKYHEYGRSIDDK